MLGSVLPSPPGAEANRQDYNHRAESLIHQPEGFSQQRRFARCFLGI